LTEPDLTTALQGAGQSQLAHQETALALPKVKGQVWISTKSVAMNTQK
jgi:hypothetical protein